MSRLNLGLALGLLISAFVLVLLSRRRRDREAAAAVVGRPASVARARAGLRPAADRRIRRRWHPERPRPRARAPTSEDVAGAMVLLAVALQSGCGVVEAIEYVAEVAPPIPARELAVVAAALRWGVAEDQAWAEVDRRWSRTAMALRMARAAGVPPSSLLLSGADDLRTARLAAVDVATARLGVRLVVPLGLAFLPAFILTTIVPVVLALARDVLAA